MNDQFNYDYNNYLKQQKKALRSDLFIKGCFVGAVLIIFVIIQVALGTVIDLFAMIFVKPDNIVEYANELVSNPYVLLATPIISIFLPFWIFALITKTKLKPLYSKPHLPVDFSLSLFSVGLGLIVIANYITVFIQLLFNCFGVAAEALELTPPDGVFNSILFVFAIAVLPAIFEEFACRGVLLTYLRRYGDRFAIICTAIIFGLMHANLIQIPFAFILGLYFAYVTIRTGNIWTSMALHCLNNLIGGISFVMLKYTSETAVGVFELSCFAIFMVLGIIASIYIATKKYSLELAPDPQLPIKRSSAVLTFFVSPGMLIAALILIGLAIYSVVMGI